MATPLPPNRAPFTLDAVAAAVGGRVRVTGPEVVGVVTDSRRVAPGNLFVALAGPTHDAHRYLVEVAGRGAAAVVVRRGAEVPVGVGVVEVEDTLRALGDLAHAHRMRWGGLVVGITGSAGKTSTKELTAAALRGAGLTVRATEGNLNNRVGVPTTLFTLDAEVRAAVVEMGTSEVGEIARLAEIAAPEVGVLTCVAAAHTAGLGSLEAVGREKGALLMAVGPEGAIVANGDDPIVRAHAAASPAGRKWLFGQGEGCDVRLLGWQLAGTRTRATYAVRGVAEPVTLELGLVGEAAALNAAAALGVVEAVGGDRDGACAAMAEAVAVAGRMQPRVGLGGLLVLDDSYNANPRSTELSLRTAARVASERGGRLLCALGDMKELGDRSEAEHARVGGMVVGAGAGLFVAVGPDMHRAAEVASDAGIPVIRVETADEAASRLQGVPRPGDVLLVKGSRSMAMEAVVRAFVADPPPREGQR